MTLQSDPRPAHRASERTPVSLRSRRPARVRLGISALLVLLIGGLSVAVVISLLGSAGSTSTLAVSPPPTLPTSTEPSGVAVYVHILGAVAAPGVYQLRDGDRVLDAVAAAGGFTPNADQRGVNLARFAVDGEQILVPEIGAGPPGTAAPPGGGATAPSKVNLNTATSEQLEELPRLGPEMASRIIAWRDANGPFTAVEDLMNVTGIGEKTFDALKDLVTV
ncbi:helix-hairpin-helix domain-containing protein [Mycetocola zhadangensis]|uniref:Competence protein ComEA n=1 Tax=Mycetocola zhadangensis TaxID=1164595 RepID=A0A3L7J6B0_9MICO|nr:ComEA family DNA-binding protein [Mycetocola zhadangensis]RLQ85989.1 competence protein ComEA [Mycetocola zhadangensis]